MSNEKLTSAQDRIWNLYQFVFQHTDTVDRPLSTSIRKKISIFNLQKDSSDIQYKKMGEDPLVLDIYIEEIVDKPWVAGLLKLPEKRIFPPSDRVIKVQALAPVEESGSSDDQLISSSADTSRNTMRNETDDTQVQAITFKGAVRNPPPSTEPLP